MSTMLAMLVAFQLKHFLADYCLQTTWMISGKGRFTALGGYAHAGLHAATSFLPLAFVLPITTATAICLVEFAVHYLIDMGKERMARLIAPGEISLTWRLHGADQFLHQLTYLSMSAAAAALFQAS